MIQLQQAYSFFDQRRVTSMIVGQVVILTVLVLLILNSVFGGHLFSAFAAISCPTGQRVYTVLPGDTLGNIAAADNTTWQTLADNNHIADPNLIYAYQQICILGTNTGVNSPAPASAPTSAKIPLHNTANLFPFGQCTWWATQRYEQLHGWFVPWTSNADAWEWTARAYDFHWHVSSQPSVGAIINFQPNVQGASDLGHVAIVEQILGNGQVLTSNMNVVGYTFGSVVELTFSVGPGVTFITAP